MNDWWKSFFTSENFPLDRVVDPSATAREVRALKRLLRGRKRVLDVACGAGRHAAGRLPWAEHVADRPPCRMTACRSR